MSQGNREVAQSRVTALIRNGHDSIRRRIESLPEAVCLLSLAAAWVAFVTASVALCGPGFLHPESYSFLPHYLSGRPLPDLIFDNRVTDWGNYQARELGFVFDWIDCRFIAWCVTRGHPHFFSATHYVFLLVAGIAIWRMATRHFGLGRLAAFGLVLLLWTGPSAVLYTSFYRAAKVGLLLVVLLTAWAWLNARASKSGAREAWFAALFAVLAALLPMFDKQGLLFLGALVLFLARNAAIGRDRTSVRLLVAGVGAVLVAFCYQRFIGPALTRSLLGYEVNRSYATIPFGELASNPRLLAKVMLGAPLLGLDSFRIALGNLSAGIAIVAAAWMGWQFVSVSSGAAPRWQSRAWIFAGLWCLVMGVYGAMLMLFPSLLSSEHRRFFYCLPVTALWFLAAMAAMAEFIRRAEERRRFVEIAILALLVSNTFALQEHRFVLRHGKYGPFIENAARVRDALRPASVAASGLTRARAAALLKEAPYFADVIPRSLEVDRIYLALLTRTVPESR
jgi:hypothetical protein